MARNEHFKKDKREYSRDLFLLPTFIKYRHFYCGASMLINQYIACMNIRILYQNFIYPPTDALVSCLKKTTILKFALKFTLKQLRHVSVLQLM